MEESHNTHTTKYDSRSILFSVINKLDKFETFVVKTFSNQNFPFSHNEAALCTILRRTSSLIGLYIGCGHTLIISHRRISSIVKHRLGTRFVPKDGREMQSRVAVCILDIAPASRYKQGLHTIIMSPSSCCV